VQRKVGSIEKTIEQSGISLDRFTRVATFQGLTVTLTQREFMLLECLMLSPGQIFSRQQILKRSWGIEFDTGTNIVDVCIQRIRKKLSDTDPKNLQPFPIESIRGVGYRLNAIK
jgi:DNA-binding response OmpR family regulator